MRITQLLYTAAFVTATTPALAQTEPPIAPKRTEMNVDMPDETEETDLIEQGQLQLETAYLYNSYQQGGSSNIGQLMLRYGLAKPVELRLLAEDGRMRGKYMDETVQSTYPLALGTKVALLKDHKWLPDMTFVGYLKLPFTSRMHSEEAYWSPLLLMAFQHTLSDKWKLEYNAGAQEEAFSSSWAGLVNSSIHYKIADPLEVFFEYYAQFKDVEEPSHNIGGGIDYQWGEHISLYASGGSRIVSDDKNFFIAGGVAFRY